MKKPTKTAKKEDVVVTLGKELAALRAQKAQLEADTKSVNEQIKEIAERKLPQIMEDREIEKITIDGIGTLYIEQKVYVGLDADQRPAAFQWLRENGHGDLVKDWVFPQTMTAFAKEQLDKNQPLPEMFKATYVPTARLRKK